jgi:hypothetical protein
MTRRLTTSLREAPVTVPALAALALFVVWATSQAGYPLTHWAPGGLIVLALLVIALLAVPLRLREIPGPVKLAVACLAAYTVLSFLSILWAGDTGAAWEGANRTLLYLLVFALFALWPGRGAGAAILLCFWTLALIGLAVYVTLRLDSATGTSFYGLFSGERLSYPAGYQNAAAAQWLMAFWPAVLLARTPRIPWGLRGAFAGGAVLLADLALLSLSRGSLYATPLVLVLVFAFVPERLRTFAIAVPVALGIGVAVPSLLRVGHRLHASRSPYAATHAAVFAMLGAALLVALVVGAAAALESHRSVSPAASGRVRRGVAILALATLLAVVGGGLALAGNPLTRIRHGWDSFKGGYTAEAANGNRLLSGLGSNRYDFYRVALDEFKNHPLVGIGTDNFQQQYLVHGRSEETPRYPHSVELRTLSQTGAIGGLLAVVGLGAALLACWRAMRRADPLARVIAAAAVVGFVYWVVHGSFDWFWEFAGLGASAFALLGIACSLMPRTPPAWSVLKGSQSPIGRWPTVALGVLAGIAAMLSLAAPWLSEREIQSAARIWPRAPLTAYSRLSEAARLNPLSDEAYLIEGGIALRFGDLARARHAFSLALERVPNDAYATLEAGAIASESGERARSLVLLRRAVRLDPRDPLTVAALHVVLAGKRVNVEELNHSILTNAEHFS